MCAYVLLHTSKTGHNINLTSAKTTTTKACTKKKLTAKDVHTH